MKHFKDFHDTPLSLGVIQSSRNLSPIVFAWFFNIVINMFRCCCCCCYFFFSIFISIPKCLCGCGETKNRYHLLTMGLYLHTKSELNFDFDFLSVFFVSSSYFYVTNTHLHMCAQCQKIVIAMILHQGVDFVFHAIKVHRRQIDEVGIVNEWQTIRRGNVMRTQIPC